MVFNSELISANTNIGTLNGMLIFSMTDKG